MIAFIIDLFFILFVLSLMLNAALRPLPAGYQARLDAAQDLATRNAINQELYAIPAINQRRVATARFWLAMVVFYHIAVRRTRGGTLGYRVAGIRLIDCHNEPPPWKVLIKRFFLGMLLAGPFGASYFLCLKDPKRQSLHDRFCNTWLVRSKATPAGPGVLVHRMKLISTLALSFLDVEPAAIAVGTAFPNCDHDFGDGEFCARCGGAKAPATEAPPDSTLAS